MWVSGICLFFYALPSLSVWQVQGLDENWVRVSVGVGAPFPYFLLLSPLPVLTSPCRMTNGFFVCYLAISTIKTPIISNQMKTKLVGVKKKICVVVVVVKEEEVHHPRRDEKDEHGHLKKPDGQMSSKGGGEKNESSL